MSEVGRLYLHSPRGAPTSICDVHCPRISAKMAGDGGMIGSTQYVMKIQNSVQALLAPDQRRMTSL